MNIRLKRQDLSGCVTNEELAQLLNDAFSSWQAGTGDVRGRRDTPRIPARDVKPIFLVSYAYGGRDFALNHRVTIVDLSADGLGIVLAQPLPIGAVVCFAFDGRTAERYYGVAIVVRVARCQDGYDVGLTFIDNARSLDVEPPADETQKTVSSPRARLPGLRRLKEASAVACRALARRKLSRRTVEKSVYGRKASFVVEAKLFRYTAALFVDGRSIICRSGVLRDRLRNLVTVESGPTMVHLQGGGFSGWATLRPWAVTDCSLDLSMQLKQHIRCIGTARKDLRTSR